MALINEFLLASLLPSPMSPLPREGLRRVFFQTRSAFSLGIGLPGGKTQYLRLQALSPSRRDLPLSSRWRPHAEAPGSLRRHWLCKSSRGTASSHCSIFLSELAIPRRKNSLVVDLPPSSRGAAGEKHHGECWKRTLKTLSCEGQTRLLSAVSPSFSSSSSLDLKSPSAFSASSASSAVSPGSLLSTRRRQCLTPARPRFRSFSTAEKPKVSSASSPEKAENWISAFLCSAEELALSPRKKKMPNDPASTSSSPASSPSSSPSLSPASSGRGLLPLFRRVSRLPLEASLLRNLKTLGVSHLTQIQDACFLPILLGKDVVGAAKPGTGKTLAYLLPLLQRSLNASPAASEDCGDDARGGEEAGGTSRREAARENARREAPSRDAWGPSILILVPTRELCRQVAATVSALAPSLSMAVLDASWASVHAQERLLDSFAQGRGRPLDLVVGAPERCEKLFLSGHLRLGGLKACVIDEADALLRRGYADRVETLFCLRSAVRRDGEKDGDAGDGTPKRTREGRDFPRHRVQTLVFTAAMPTELQAIVDSHFKQATVVNLLKKTSLRTPSTPRGNVAPKPGLSSRQRVRERQRTRCEEIKSELRRDRERDAKR
ncbi:DEAD/DEAH box helicase domain-containing protein [Toxoplasma gondii ARI]|uniref:RNA helicase n=1 Tax=Toxoplasma gondii ARI TaxID=1074872 RepID=A0A139XWT5_TOXGO|nr:DEAD/DEAH box helicase domain-containing protein [Toxoplasma gondii ARI]